MISREKPIVVMLSRLHREARARLAPEPPAPPVVTRIPVKPGNLGTALGYKLRVPVRIIKRVRIEVHYAKDN